MLVLALPAGTGLFSGESTSMANELASPAQRGDEGLVEFAVCPLCA